MNLINSQKGVTLIGWLIIIGFFALLGTGIMRLYPVYYDYYLVKESLNSLAKDKNIKRMSKEEIYKKFQSQFIVNNIHTVDYKDLLIVKNKDKLNLKMIYEARAPFIFNINFAVNFDYQILVE